MAKIKRAKYFTRNFSTCTILYGRVQTAKIKLHENLSHEIFLTRKFHDLRYVGFDEWDFIVPGIIMYKQHL